MLSILIFVFLILLFVLTIKSDFIILKWPYILPLILTILCILWAGFAQQYTTFEEHFKASIPVFLYIPLNIIMHVFFIIKRNGLRKVMIGYGILHLPIVVFIFIVSLMLVTHDSL